MTRLLPPLLLAISFCLPVLLACGKSSESGKSAAKKDATLSLQVFADPAETASYRELVAAYEKGHPDQNIELLSVGKQKDHMARLATAFAAGDPPDLFILNFRRFGQFAGKAALAPLGDMMVKSGQFKPDEFYAPAVEAFNFEGSQYCLPQNISSLVVYYNRDLFKQRGVPEPKANWSLGMDFIEAAKKLSFVPEGGSERDKVYGLGFEPSLIRIAPFIWSAGGGLVNDLNRPSVMMIDRARGVNTLATIKSLRTVYGVTPGLAEVQAQDLESRFAAGKLAMLLQSRRYSATLRELDHKGQKLDWDVAPLPVLGLAATVLHADGYCMAKSTKHTEAAKAFVSYAMSDEGQSILAKSGRIVPSRIATAQSPAFLDPTQKPLHAQVFLDVIPTILRTPNTAAWHEIESKADTLLEEFFYEAPLPGESGAGYGEARLVAEAIRDATQPLLLADLKKK